MSKIDILGHIATLWLVTGTSMLSMKNRLGWLVRAVGQVLWILIGAIMGMTSIWIWGLVFVAMDIWGYFKWKKNDE